MRKGTTAATEHNCKEKKSRCTNLKKKDLILKLFDILPAIFPEFKPLRTKIHLASWNGSDNPLDVYFAGEFNEWQQWQSKQNFNRAYVLSLIALPKTNEWLFAGLYKRIGEPKNIPAHWDQSKMVWHYELIEEEPSKEFDGRIVASFIRPGRQSYLKADSWASKIDLCEIYPTKLNVGNFPGYKCLNITKSMLDIIVEKQVPTWKTALENVAGVYLISDKITGKLYVGSANGEGGIWQRWVSYSKSGHGGNVEIAALTRQNCLHPNGFSFSILEIADIHESPEHILSRESHWKRVLQTREHGLNSN